MEAALATAEGAVVAAAVVLVEAAANSPRPILTAACAQSDVARAKVEKLYARWEELEAKRSGL